MRIEQKNGEIACHYDCSAPKTRGKDVGSLLIDQVRALAGPDFDVKMVRVRPWASIIFSGTRHSMKLSPRAGRVAVLPPSFAEQIGEHEFNLPGHFVADVLVDDRAGDGDGDAVLLEILTIIDPVAG